MSAAPPGVAHQVRAAPRPAGLAVRLPMLAVDTANAAPPQMARFRPLNPFTVARSVPLPVPGRPDLEAYSVEAIWQGLKVVDGRLDLAMLTGWPAKRPPEDERVADPGYQYEASRFRYGDRELDLVTARRFIYVPAYLAMLELRLPATVEAEIGASRHAGRNVVFYDWDDNVTIEDASRSWSHSAILASWFGGRLEDELLRPAGLRANHFPRYLGHHARRW